MMGSIIDRRELGTRKRVDASMIATTSGWLCTVGALPGVLAIVLPKVKMMWRLAFLLCWH
jgi:hypothetical protein